MNSFLQQCKGTQQENIDPIERTPILQVSNFQVEGTALMKSTF